MKLYLLRAHPRFGGYDVATGFVVRAASARAARALAAKHCSNEGPDVWTDPQNSRCTRISDKGVAEVLMVDVNEG